MARHTNDNQTRAEHADNLLPSKGGNCAGCGKFIAPIPGATSKHDERILILVRDSLTVEAIKYLRDETGCGLADARTMVEHTYGLAARLLRPPCAACGAPLRTPREKVCAECGARVDQ